MERITNRRTERMYQCMCVEKETENSSFPSSLLTVIHFSRIIFSFNFVVVDMYIFIVIVFL